ncbi:MAG: hypothetical protein R3C56_14390 [Pirellulaceae bacterium]
MDDDDEDNQLKPHDERVTPARQSDAWRTIYTSIFAQAHSRKLVDEIQRIAIFLQGYGSARNPATPDAGNARHFEQPTNDISWDR